MKKALQIIAYSVPIALLAVLWYFLAPVPEADPVFILIFALCLLGAPLVSVFRFPRFIRGFLYGFSIFTFIGGIPASFAIGGAAPAFVMLFFGLFAVSILMIQRALPEDSPIETHLFLRGMPGGKIRKKLLTKQSYAFFFLYAAPLTALLSGWLVFIRGTFSPSYFFSLSAASVFVSLFGFILYCLFGAPLPRTILFGAKKIKKILLWVFLLLLAVITAYVYTGQYYTAPEPEFCDALHAAKSTFTPAIIGAFGAFLCGTLLGLILSCLTKRLFLPVCRALCAFPLPLLSGLLTLWFPLPLAILMPLLPVIAEATLESRTKTQLYKQFPPHGRKKAILWPLFFRPCLVTLVFAITSSLFTSVLLNMTVLRTFADLSSPALLFTAAVFAVTGAFLYGICYLIKEASHHG